MLETTNVIRQRYHTFVPIHFRSEIRSCLQNRHAQIKFTILHTRSNNSATLIGAISRGNGREPRERVQNTYLSVRMTIRIIAPPLQERASLPAGEAAQTLSVHATPPPKARAWWPIAVFYAYQRGMGHKLPAYVRGMLWVPQPSADLSKSAGYWQNSLLVCGAFTHTVPAKML